MSVDIVFRADASLQIGTGHVMRCLTLAEALKSQGYECLFLCREHPGHLIEAIEARGFTVHRLPIVETEGSVYGSQQVDAAPDHAHWLGATWQQDAAQCQPILKRLEPGWLVVDHYALDTRWETAMLPEGNAKPTPRLLVIDDLADRPHRADLLLDQNLGREADSYASLVPSSCRVLAGPQYALLRPEFAALREFSLARRHAFQLNRLLISLGGVDKDNATGQVLEALKHSDLPADCEITVVMGATAPWLEDVRTRAAKLPWMTHVVVNVADMAQRMAMADLAIGAAGSTSWERCCLGLPTLMLVLANNQQPIAQALEESGAAICLGTPDHIHELVGRLVTVNSANTLQAMSHAASQVTAGEGVKALCNAISQRDSLA